MEKVEEISLRLLDVCSKLEDILIHSHRGLTLLKQYNDLWLDFANAYDKVSQEITEEDMESYWKVIDTWSKE